MSSHHHHGRSQAPPPPPPPPHRSSSTTLLDMVKVEQKLQLKHLEAQQQYQEQKNSLETAQREVDAAKKALQELLQGNLNDQAKLFELNAAVAELRKKSEQAGRNVSGSKHALEATRAKEDGKAKKNKAASEALDAGMETLKAELQIKSKNACAPLKLDVEDRRLVEVTEEGLYVVVCDERGIKQAKEDAVNMEGWLRKQKEKLANLEKETKGAMDEDEEGEEDGATLEAELARLKKALEGNKAALGGKGPGRGGTGGEGQGEEEEEDDESPVKKIAPLPTPPRKKKDKNKGSKNKGSKDKGGKETEKEEGKGKKCGTRLKQPHEQEQPPQPPQQEDQAMVAAAMAVAGQGDEEAMAN